MKKVLLIMAAALMTMTQCRKQETVPATPSADTIKMTITAGPGAKTNITDEGAITWTSGDVLYVSDGDKWLGSLTLQSGAGNARGTFTGNISEISNGTTCHFFYLGKGIVTTTPSGTTAASISFASQDGSREGALKYHLGHGSADVTVSGGVATGAVAMRTEIAIAHLKLKMDGEDYKGKVTMDVSNTMTVSPAGTFSGSGNGIAIGNNGGTSGDRYVTLIPTEATSVSFSGSATGSMTFGHGIQANNLYGMENGIEVTLTALSYLPGEFTINSSGTKVKFSKGNLWYDGSAFHFEENQWDTNPTAVNQTGSSGTYSESHVSHFFWSNTTDWQESGKEPYAASYSYSTQTTDDVFFTEAEGFQVGSETDWRTLSKDEWAYLINTRSGNRFAKAKVSGVTGLLIFPDVYSGTTSGTGIAAVNTTNAAFPGDNIPSDTWATMESAGVVFLPAAGFRLGTGMSNVGSHGRYWSSTPHESREDVACSMSFESDKASTGGGGRNGGFAVRLVR